MIPFVKKRYTHYSVQKTSRKLKGVKTLVSDQVSSTALVVDASGNKVAETRYLPFGEERYTSGTSPTDKT
jgi:hypothetical protein